MDRIENDSIAAVDEQEAQRLFWNARAEEFSAIAGRSGYARGFLNELVSNLGCELDCDIFDMGCGPGTLAVPLAQLGCDVFACDISEAMLEQLQKKARTAGVSVQTKALAWQDDWVANGIREKSFDVAIASRSIRTSNLAELMGKLERVARKLVAISVPAGPAELVDLALCKALGRNVEMCRADADVFQILADWGRCPHVKYLDSEWSLACASLDELRYEVRRFAGDDPFSQEEQECFDEFIAEHSVAVEQGDALFYKLDRPIPIRWCLFIWQIDCNENRVQ